MAKKDRKLKKEDKEKIKRLFETQKILDKQNKEMLNATEMTVTSKNLFTDLGKFLSKQNKKQKRENSILPQKVQSIENESNESGAESPVEIEKEETKVNLFTMKKFEAPITEAVLEQSSKLLNENEKIAIKSNVFDLNDNYDPFKNNAMLLEDSLSDEDNQNIIGKPQEDQSHDSHLKKMIVEYDPILFEINELEMTKNLKFNNFKINPTQKVDSGQGRPFACENEESKKESVLPILQLEFEIIEAIKQNLVTVVCGSTGSGKSTQVPRFLCEAGLLKYGAIGVTQPRRIAATSLANRVADETNTSVGETVGFQVRFESKFTSDSTKIKFMTDGILLNELMNDFLLNKYSVIIIDEAHERKLATDVLIGILSRVVKIRAKLALKAYKEASVGSKPAITPLRLVLMSATLKIEDFTENISIFAKPPPVISVEAKRYPVFTYYNKETEEDYITDAIEKVRKIHTNLPNGGVLVFLTGREEVLNFCRKLYNELRYIRKAKPKTVASQEENENTGDLDLIEEDEEDIQIEQEISQQEDDLPVSECEENQEEDDKMKFEHETFVILPLFSKLPVKLQERIFQQNNDKRIIVVSTNVAETSLTIDGLKYVVDCGKEKNKYIDPKTGLEQFKVEWTTQSSAEQRSGRAGRTQIGYCYRLYTPAVFSKLEKHKAPEITRLPLNYTILQMVKIGIKNVYKFPFPTPPEHQRLRQSVEELVMLGAITLTNQDSELQITELGEALSYIPLEPRYSKIILQCNKTGLLSHGLLLAASLITDELFASSNGVNMNNRQEVGQFREQYQHFMNSNSDLLTIVNIFADFFKGKKMQEHFRSLSNLKSLLKKDVSLFCSENNIALKPFTEAITFIFQILQIFCFIFDSEVIDELFRRLQFNKKLDFSEENILIEIIVSNFIKNAARKVISFDEKDKQKISYETLDYKSAKLFYKSFVNRSGQYFVYKNVFQIEE